MSPSVFEIVTYTVADIDQAQQGRARAHEALKSYPGFRGWTPFTAVEGEAVFIDLVEWDTLENARAAQDAFLTDPATEAFRAAFGKTIVMKHAVV